jgi:tetratricopeptide (TPR) repeat protein
MSDRLAQLTKLHQADPKDPFCTYGLALEHLKAGAHEEALQWLDATIALDANYCYAYFQKGKVLAELGQVEAAHAVLHAGLNAAKSCGDAKAHDEIGALLESLG